SHHHLFSRPSAGHGPRTLAWRVPTWFRSPREPSGARVVEDLERDRCTYRCSTRTAVDRGRGDFRRARYPALYFCSHEASCRSLSSALVEQISIGVRTTLNRSALPQRNPDHALSPGSLSFGYPSSIRAGHTDLCSLCRSGVPTLD